MGSKSAPGRSQNIDLRYQPRPWQNEVHRTRRRFTIAVVHRRGGKSQLAEAELVDTALRVSGAVLAYVAPTRSQAKTVIWQRLKDFTRPVPGLQVHEQELRITFPNGSCVFLAGALDGADGLRGVGLDGVVLDEFGLMADSVFPSVVRPALADRQGWAIFIGTPMGRDPLFRLMQATRGLPDWSHFIFPAPATGVLPVVELAAARSTMPEDAYHREFLCSFDAHPEGSIYGRVISALRAAGRIVPSIPWVEGIDTWASLDLGIADSTSAWVGQSISTEHRILAYREWTGVGLAAIARILHDMGVTHVHAPHDIKVRELTTARSRLDTLTSLGLRVQVAVRAPVEEGIAATQRLLARCIFDETYCSLGLDRLGMYRRDHDERHGGYGPPVHDIASHAADSLRYAALCLSERGQSVVRGPDGQVYRLARRFKVTSSLGGEQEVIIR